MAGVVKNLMVRVGADLSGLVSGFKKGSGATTSFAKRAAKDISSLKNNLSQMESAYQSIRDATARVNIAQPISKQIADSRKSYESLQKTALNLEKQIDWWGSVEPIGQQFKTDALRAELHEVDLKVKNLVQNLAQLEDIDSLGKKLGLNEVSSKSLNKLQTDIMSVKDELRAAESAAKETKQTLNMMGVLKGIASSTSKIEKLAGSIKKIGLLSFGLRLTKALFGELQSVVTQYVSQNAALQAQVTALKTSLGQALAPAINLVANAMSALMPYVVGVSNAIGSLISNLFGSGWTTLADGATDAAAAIGGAGGAQKEFNRQLAGFDEITKLNAESSGGGGGSSATTTATEGITPTWLTSLSEQIKQAASEGDFFGIGAALANAVNTGIESINLSDTSLGSKVADFINTGIAGATGFVETMDWSGLGEAIKKNVSGLIGGIDWAGAFRFLGSASGGIASALGSALSDAFSGIAQHFHESIAEAEELGLDIMAGIGIGIGKALGNIGVWIKDNIFKPFVEGFKKTFDIHSPSQNEEINSLGENILLGIFKGITDALSDPVSWIKDNVFTPLSEGFKKVFGKNGTIASFFSSNEETPTVDFKANLTSWKDSLKEKVASFKANFTTWKSSLKNKVTSFKANFTTWKSSLKDKVTSFKANFTTWKSSLKNKVTSFKANFTTWKSSLKNKVTSFKANFTTWKSSLKKKVVPVKANFTTWKSSLKKKVIPFKANMTTWKDKLGNKSLTFSANVKKGWTGSIARKLGISSITSTLNMKLPKISIDWGSTYIFGKDFRYPKGFSIKWNAMGGILNGAQIFGRVGNTLLGGGEAGREAVLPLDRNTWWMDKIADRVAFRVAGAGQSGVQNITIQLVLDGKVITNTVVRNVNAQARATGHHPFAAYI